MFIASDESKQGRFYTIGSLWLPETDVPTLESQASELRVEAGMWGEVKWENIDSTHQDEYKKYLDLFFDGPNRFFTCFIMNTEELDYSYFGGSRAASFSSFCFTSIHHTAEKMYRRLAKQPLHIIFDQEVLQNRSDYLALHERLERTGHDVSQCCACTSHITAALQIADLLTGAVSAVWNNRATGRNDRAIVDYIEGKAGEPLSTENVATGFGFNKIHKWLFRPPAHL
jgi:hypothetical protein